MSSKVEQYFKNLDALRALSEMTSDDMARERSRDLMRLESTGPGEDKATATLSLRWKTYMDAYFPYHIAHTNQATQIDYAIAARTYLANYLKILSGDKEYERYFVERNDVCSFDGLVFTLSIHENQFECEDLLWLHIVDLSQQIYHTDKYAHVLYYNGPISIPNFGVYGAKFRQPEEYAMNYLSYYHKPVYDSIMGYESGLQGRQKWYVEEGDRLNRLLTHAIRKQANKGCEYWVQFPFLKAEDRRQRWLRYEKALKATGSSGPEEVK